MNRIAAWTSRRWIISVVLAACWIGAFTATHIPAKEMPKLPATDKTLHFVGFLVLTGLFVLTLSVRGVGSVKTAIIAAVVMAVYGACDELTQPPFNRYASLDDWIADASGALAAILVWLAVKEVSKRLTRTAAPGND